VLIAAVAHELVFEALQLAKMSGFPALGFCAGAATFFVGDKVIGAVCASGRKSIEASHASSFLVPLVLGIILDGVPGLVVIGLDILEAGTVSLAMLVAVFISSVAESVAVTASMRASSLSPRRSSAYGSQSPSRAQSRPQWDMRCAATCHQSGWPSSRVLRVA
jgi:ZIP family zinc transporter